MRNFFYQCFKGYWDSANQRFQFGTHLQGIIYNEVGQIVRGVQNASLAIRNDVNIAESNWTSIFQEKAVDFLLEQHSLATMRILEQMESSQYMRDAVDIDGSVKNTHAAVKRALDLNPTNEAKPSNPRRGYEIQVPSDSNEGRTL